MSFAQLLRSLQKLTCGTSTSLVGQSQKLNFSSISSCSKLRIQQQQLNSDFIRGPSTLNRLSANTSSGSGILTATVQRRFAGRWYEQPLVKQRRSGHTCAQRRHNSNVPAQPPPTVPSKDEQSDDELDELFESLDDVQKDVANLAKSVQPLPIKDMTPFKADAAPVYYQPERTETVEYSTVNGPGGTLLAGFRLYCDSIDRTQLHHKRYHELTVVERNIYVEHMKAVQQRKMFYIDPYTAQQVFTVSQLLLNGKCCGSACRHCPYGHENVPEDIRKKKLFNGSYYV